MNAARHLHLVKGAHNEPEAATVAGAVVEQDSKQPKDEWFDTKPWEVVRWVFRRCKWAAREKNAYLALYTRRSAKSPMPYPGMETLGEDMGTTDDAASAAVKQLAALGAVIVHRCAGPKNTHKYELLPPWKAQQIAVRKPRGKHAAPSKQGGTLKNGVAPTLKQGEGGPLKQGTKEPIPRSQEKEQNLNLIVEPAVNGGIDASPSSSKKGNEGTVIDDETGKHARELVVLINIHLKEHGAQIVTQAKFPAAVKTAKALLSSKSSSTDIPFDEAVAAIEWAFPDEYWREQFIAYGFNVLRRAWAKWREKGRTTSTPSYYAQTRAFSDWDVTDAGPTNAAYQEQARERAELEERIREANERYYGTHNDGEDAEPMPD